MFIIFDIKVDAIDSSRGIQAEKRTSEQFQWSDLKKLNFVFWLIVVNCIFTYSGLLFYNISNDFFMTRYGFTQVEAGRLGSDAFIVCIFLAPVFGVISDKIGRRVSFALISTCMLTL